MTTYDYDRNSPCKIREQHMKSPRSCRGVVAVVVVVPLVYVYSWLYRSAGKHIA